MKILDWKLVAIVALVLALAGCGGGGEGGEGAGGLENAGGDTPAEPIGTPSAGMCSQANFNLDAFNAISPGMTLKEVTDVIGCESNTNAATAEFTSYGWIYGASVINVLFDPARSEVAEFGGQHKTAANLNIYAGQSLPACSESNFTLDAFNAITPGMTPDQVGQAIGCHSTSNTVTSEFVSVGWGVGSTLIDVRFDIAASAVTDFGGQHKTAVNLTALGAQELPACEASNLNVTSFNAITVGMTVEQVSQTIGCQSNTNAATSEFITLGWGAGGSLINVYFDTAGTLVTQFVGQYKTAVNLNNAVIPTMPACSASHLTMQSFNAVAVGMTLDEVNQAIGCQGNLGSATTSFLGYQWASGSSLINVLFDPAGEVVTEFGGQYKTGVKLTVPHSQNLPACGAGNITAANFDAITAGMTFEEVGQLIGCSSNTNAVTSSFVSFGWGSGSSLINVYFDLAGEIVTQFGPQLKTGVNLN